MLFEEEKEVNIEIDNNVDIPEPKPAKKPLHFGKRIALFLTGWLGFSIISIVVSFIYVLLNGQEAATSSEGTGVINFISYGILFATLMAILNVDLVRIIDVFKNWKGVLVGLGFAAAIIVVPTIYNLIVNLFYPIDISENEQGLRGFIVIYPVLSIFILGIVGPLCEELTYRVGLFGLLKKWPWVAYIVSTLVFALMHFGFTTTGDAMIQELLNLPIYLFSGAMFALAYHKFGLSASITAHIINNSFTVVLVIINGLIA